MASLIQQAGRELASLFPSARDFKVSLSYRPFRATFKAALVARGVNEANVKAYWARVLYREAWPGQGRVNGVFYIRLADGSVVKDKGVMMEVE